MWVGPYPSLFLRSRIWNVHGLLSFEWEVKFIHRLGNLNAWFLVGGSVRRVSVLWTCWRKHITGFGNLRPHPVSSSGSLLRVYGKPWVLSILSQLPYLLLAAMLQHWDILLTLRNYKPPKALFSNSDVSLFTFCPDGLCIRESVVLILPTINGLVLICVFKSSSRFFVFY